MYIVHTFNPSHRGIVIVDVVMNQRKSSDRGKCMHNKDYLCNLVSSFCLQVQVLLISFKEGANYI